MNIYYVTYRIEVIPNEYSNRISQFITATSEEQVKVAILKSDNRVAMETINIKFCGVA